MGFGDTLAVGQVGDGACDAQDAVIGPAGPLEAFHAALEQRLALLVEFAETVDVARIQILVALALALQLDFGGRLHAGGDGGRGFAIRLGSQDVGIDRADFDLDVDAVE
jgi:hypothetical protein